jgi:apolipoprotein N-acyltransferase
MNTVLKRSFLALGTGLLFWAGWPPLPLFFLLFVALVPLLELSNAAGLRGWKRFGWIYLALFGWNLSTTWWVWNSTVAGAAVMLVMNTLFMCIPWLIYARYKNRLGEAAEYLLVILWLIYEFLHHRWDLSWPWLTLGNGLAEATWLVQWYDVTGTLAGSAFILAMNVLIWKAMKTRKRFYIAAPVCLFAFVWASSVFSELKWEKSATASGKATVVVCQPSYDPWNEKFVRPSYEMIGEMINLSAKQVDSSTELLIWPETSLTEGIDVNYTAGNGQLALLRTFQKKYPKLRILAGADMQEIYENSPERPNATARKTSTPNVWWNAYNSAVLCEPQNKTSLYHKSILVPGTEQMPFTGGFPFIDKLAISLDKNSISGSLGRDTRAKALGEEPLRVAPIICYESIYGDYTGRFVKDGARLLCIVTNDAWWGNTPGYKQHLSYAKLRAIEQRKWVARSANTGISGFINPKGTLVQETKWWEKTAIENKVVLYSGQTLYCRTGDSLWLLILCGLCIALGFLKTYKIKLQ